MDYSTLQSRVDEYLERHDTGVSTKIKNWINDTRKDIALKYNFGYLMQESYMTMTAGTARYALPTDYLGKLTLYLANKSDAKKRIKLDKVQSARYFADQYLQDGTTGHPSVVDGGIPSQYVEYGTEFELCPTPNATAASTYYLYMWYYAQPSNFSVDSEEDHISRYHFEAIIYGAVKRGAMFFDDQYKFQQFTELYDKAIAEMVVRENRMKTEDLHPRMKHWSDFTPGQMRRKMGLRSNLD